MASNKENMKQAMKELLGMVGIGPEGDKDRDNTPNGIDLNAEQQEVAQTMEKEIFGGSNQPEEQHFAGGFARRHENQADEMPLGTAPERTEESTVPAFTPDPNMTIISAGTSIFGDMRSEGTVEVRGKLKGDLEAVGNIRITGKVLGDVKGDAVVLVGCAVQGNITANSTLHIDQGSVVVGDVTADDLLTDGKVKGNILVEKTAAFQKNAVLAGNVSAGLVSMCEGAKIQGAVRISQDSETNALFGDNLEI